MGLEVARLSGRNEHVAVRDPLEPFACAESSALCPRLLTGWERTFGQGEVRLEHRAGLRELLDEAKHSCH